MSVKIVTGDLFEEIKLVSPTVDLIVIPHVVNNCRVASAGFVRPLYSAFPDAYTEYMESSQELGTNSYWRDGRILVVNMMAQDKFPSSTRRRAVHYGHLARCMVLAALHIRKCLDTIHPQKAEIHCPKFASGIGGADERIVQEFIESLWKMYPVTIYELSAATEGKNAN